MTDDEIIELASNLPFLRGKSHCSKTELIDFARRIIAKAQGNCPRCGLELNSEVADGYRKNAAATQDTNSTRTGEPLPTGKESTCAPASAAAPTTRKEAHALAEELIAWAEVITRDTEEITELAAVQENTILVCKEFLKLERELATLRELAIGLKGLKRTRGSIAFSHALEAMDNYLRETEGK